MAGLDYQKLKRAFEIIDAAPVPKTRRKVFFATYEQYEAFCREFGVEPDTRWLEWVKTEPIILES